MATNSIQRIPRHYDGTEPTARQVRHLLPHILSQIGAAHRERPDLVLAAWPHVLGEKLAPMTQAVSFHEGILTVKVKNSTLLSLLAQHERLRLMRSLQEKFPSIKIKNLVFRIG